MRITAIKPGKRGGYDLFLEDEYALTVGAEIVLANDLAVTLLGQAEAILLVLDDHQPLEPFVEVSHLVLARREGVVLVGVRTFIVRPLVAGLAALGAFPRVVLPADPLLERMTVLLLLDH